VSGPKRYPFTAVVGQDEMKLALLLNAINPRLGGVLIRGEKGTAKSTAARGIATLLPALRVVDGCRFVCDPQPGAPRCPECAAREAAGESPLPAIERGAALVELPIGATEDRVLGTLDLERALKQGERHFEPGLLANANRGLLYVDEVNLLPDHLVDTLLDAAATGVNTVEREGLSFSHPAAFVLVGTMNPEEGELRPQLLDRFALAVDVAGMPAPVERAEVVRRRIAYEADPQAFGVRWHAAEEVQRAAIAAARELLPRVQVDDDLLDLIATICTSFEVDGLRADIVIYKAAATLAACDGRRRATPEDVRRAAELALPHRRRRQPFDQPGLDRDRLDQLVQDHSPPDQDPPDDGGSDSDDESPDGSAPAGPVPAAETRPGSSGDQPAADRVFEVGAAPRLSTPPGLQRDTAPARGNTPLARAARTRTAHRIDSPTGRHIRSAPPSAAHTSPLGALDVAATLLAAAPYQVSRSAPRPARIQIERRDVRLKLRQERGSACTLFVVDASGSMAARRRMAAAKGAVVSLLTDAYQQRTQVGLIAFRGVAAELVLPPTTSAALAYACLRDLPTGGRTPLATALTLAESTLSRWKASRSAQPATGLVVLVSDCRANVAPGGGDPLAEALAVARSLRAAGILALVVDTEEGPVRLGLARQVSDALGGSYLRLADLPTPSGMPHPVASAVRVLHTHTHTQTGA
jgi:magnesium chelatase subunit D